MNSSHDTDMDSAVAALKSQLLEASINAAPSLLERWGVTDSDNAVSARQGNLEQYQAKIDELNTTLRAQVVAETLEWPRWQAVATTTSSGIAQVAGYDIGWSNLWTDVVEKSASDAATKLQETAKSVGDSLPWYAAGLAVILVLILAIKVT